MYENILVPTDGSDTAEAAVDQAVDLAANYDAAVHALYVVDVDAVSYSLGSEQVDRIRRGDLDDMPELRQAADTATGYVAKVATAADVPVEQHVRAGQPARVISTVVDDLDSNLVVMGSHGRSGISRALLGSVAEDVLRSTTLPVLVVDASEED